jgi:hypothetical protein
VSYSLKGLGQNDANLAPVNPLVDTSATPLKVAFWVFAAVVFWKWMKKKPDTQGVINRNPARRKTRRRSRPARRKTRRRSRSDDFDTRREKAEYKSVYGKQWKQVYEKDKGISRPYSYYGFGPW